MATVPDSWPRDPSSGRFLCLPEHPMPKGANGLWRHPNATCTGGCSEGCCDDYTCPVCGVEWRYENPQ
jgi:hypothetical protein